MGDFFGGRLKEIHWNPLTGCSRVNASCRPHCWALAMARRFGKTPDERAFVPLCHPERMKLPKKSTAAIFANWFADWGCDGFSCEQREEIMRFVMDHYWHTFLLLSKEPAVISHLIRASSTLRRINEARYDANARDFPWCLFGTSASTQAELDARLPALCETPAKNLFLMLEPLLGPVVIPPELLKKLCWVVVGGESGPKARPMHPQWMCDVRGQCQDADVAFCFKQWGDWKEEIWTRLPHEPCLWLYPWGTTLRCDNGPIGPNCAWPGTGAVQTYEPVYMRRVGKKDAGCILDDQEYYQFPPILQRFAKEVTQ